MCLPGQTLQKGIAYQSVCGKERDEGNVFIEPLRSKILKGMESVGYASLPSSKPKYQLPWIPQLCINHLILNESLRHECIWVGIDLFIVEHTPT
jgi:hypothetical protein